MKTSKTHLKRTLVILFTLIMMTVGMTKMYAYDFSAVCETGQTLYYNITNTTNHYVEITYPYDFYFNWNGYTKPSGDIILPESVQYNGVTYTVTSIKMYAFNSCDGLTSVVIPNSVISIGSTAFYYCSSLTSIEISNSVNSIGSSAFEGCSSLTSVEIPNSVTYIGTNPFADCPALMQIIVNQLNMVYDSREGCNAIIKTSTNALVTGCMNTVIPNSVTSIATEAFLGCTSLISIDIPNSVTSIGNDAFFGCTSMTSIVIPNAVTSIETNPFRKCSGLIQVIVETGNTVYDSRENCNAIIETSTNELITGCKNTIIPNSVTSVGSKAFYHCTGMTSIDIPNSVISIGSYAFNSCNSLTSIVIPNSMTSIGNYAFYYCDSLTSMTILADNPPVLGNGVFDNVPKDIPVYVPIGTIEAYQNTDGWNEFTNYQEIETPVPPTDYISDGLIMYLDGIYNTRNGHSTTTDVWEDLIGNYDLTVSNYSSYSWEDNHFIGLGDGGYLNTGHTWQYFNSLNDDITFEIVTYIDCDKTSPSYRGLVGWHSGNDGTNCQNDQGSGRMQTLGELPVSDADDQIATVSYTRNNGSFLNGSWKTNANTIPSGINSNQTVVFGNSWAQCRGWNDSIYCIRMYNRTLTPEEIAYNHSIDIERFGAGNGGTTSLGEFTYMSPTDNYHFTTLPIVFSWDAVTNAQYYDIYLWNANDPMPEEPFVSRLNNGYYSCASLPNHQTYQWYVEAYNPYDTISSNIRTFTLDVEQALNVSTNNIDFGDVALNQSESRTLNVNGIALEDNLTIELVGNDASMFSFATETGWDDYSGGTITVTFQPTATQWEYHAALLISSGEFTQYVTLLGSVADVYVFNTYVEEEVYAMNTAIPIHGSVMDNENAPVTHVEVEIGVFVMGMKRSLQATTDENGQFSATFNPMFSESGHYTVNSGRVGNQSTAVHDDFNIPGMAVVTEGYVLCPVTQNQPKTESVRLRNKSNLPLSDIQVSVISAPEGCSISFMSLSLDGMETDDLVFTINGTELTQGNQYQEIKLKATSSEGAETDFTIWYYCKEPRGILDVAPKNITTTMTKGTSKIIDVMLSNHGEGATGEITIDLPEVEWM